MQKCDAKRPCSTCVLAERISECVYHDQVHSADDRQSGQHPGDAEPHKIPTVISIGSPVELNPAVSDEAVTQVVAYEPTALRTFVADRAPHGRSSGLTLVLRNSFEQRIPLDSNPSISIFSSLLPSTIPVEPWISLSFLGEEKLQVQFSETDATDLDMRS